MKLFKLAEHTKQYFVTGKIGGEKKERLVGEHYHVIGYFNNSLDAISVGEEIADIMPTERIIENKDDKIYAGEYHHFRMDYDLEVDLVDLDIKIESYPVIAMVSMRAFQDTKYPKVRYHNYNNRIYLYNSEEDIEASEIIEDASEAEEEKK